MFLKFSHIFAAEFSGKDYNGMVKQRIIEEASELFAGTGVKSTTMDDLARHMGISKRTIYENFKDKEALLIACIDSFHRESAVFSERVFSKEGNVVDAILLMMQKSAEQTSLRRLDMLNDIRKYYPQVFKDRLMHMHDDKCRGMGQLILRGIDEGVFRDDLNPEIIAVFFSKRADGIAMADRDLDRFSLAEVFENVIITFLRGICTPEGIEIINRYKEKTAKSK
ncbi:MAG: TetR/AcrR family transcriptional regulator [Bacteroidales bacterium]|jgi:AcrR family transcriptional regulator|nr:TetR/AcrR family transcriptional regulator [Bacteroidales bacterium]